MSDAEVHAIITEAFIWCGLVVAICIGFLAATMNVATKR